MFAIHIKARRLLKRYTLEIFFFIFILVVGITIGMTINEAFGAEKAKPKPKAVSIIQDRPEFKVKPAMTTTTTTTTTAPPVERKSVQAEPVAVTPSIPLPPGSHADWLREAGVPEDQLGNAEWLVNHENGLWCPTRGYGQNYCPETPGNTSKAYGIPQALPGTKMASAGADWATNPITQLRWMNTYVGRYGGWVGAKDAWISRARVCPNNPSDFCGGWY